MDSPGVGFSSYQKAIENAKIRWARFLVLGVLLVVFQLTLLIKILGIDFFESSTKQTMTKTTTTTTTMTTTMATVNERRRLTPTPASVKYL